MSRKFHRLLIFIFISLILLPVYSEAIKVVSWNICAFPGTTGTSREDDFRKVLEQLQPDILVVQEMVNQFGLNQFLNNVLDQSFPGTYEAAPFFDSTYSDNALFYKKSVIRIISHQQITTALRDISEYYLEILEGPEIGTKFRIYSVHLKAGSSPSDKEKRDDEAKILRDFLNGLPKNSLFLVCGTFYMQSSKENAFRILTGRQKDNDGRTKDPLGKKGKWHDKRKHRVIHTQSSRISNFGGGYGGGLDDRFDMILISYGFSRSNELTYVAGSCVAYGNDGKHLNKAVNDGKNKSVSNDIADALYEASDHLPVIIELRLPERKPKPGDWSSSKIDFGKFEFVVSPKSDNITSIMFNFSNWRGRSGGVRVIPGTPWAISDGKFEINVDMSDPWNPQADDWTFKGTFLSNKKAKGTWKEVTGGATYSGSWTAKPKK